MTRDEREPFEDVRDLPVPEVGDLGSFEREPDHGYPDAPPPEVESVPFDVPDVDLQSATSTDDERNV